MIRVSLQPTFIFLHPLQRPHSPSPLRPCNSWKKQNRHSLDATATKAFHPRTGLPLLSSPVRNAHTLTHTSPKSKSSSSSSNLCIHYHKQARTHTYWLSHHRCLCSCVCHNNTLTTLYFEPSEALLTDPPPAFRVNIKCHIKMLKYLTGFFILVAGLPSLFSTVNVQIKTHGWWSQFPNRGRAQTHSINSIRLKSQLFNNSRTLTAKNTFIIILKFVKWGLPCLWTQYIPCEISSMWSVKLARDVLRLSSEVYPLAFLSCPNRVLCICGRSLSGKIKQATLTWTCLWLDVRVWPGPLGKGMHSLTWGLSRFGYQMQTHFVRDDKMRIPFIHSLTV